MFTFEYNVALNLLAEGWLFYLYQPAAKSSTFNMCCYDGKVQPRRGRESLKGPIALAIDAQFDVFIWRRDIFNYLAFMKVYKWFYQTSNPHFLEKSQPVPGSPNQSCSAFQNFSWRPCLHVLITRDIFINFGYILKIDDFKTKTTV